MLLKNKIKKPQKAAMFGLDARIALAIFGALSVITGATLFSVIKTNEITKTTVFLSEISKALDAYYLDVGNPLPQETSVHLRAEYLIYNGENSPTWKGPYFPDLVDVSSRTDIVSYTTSIKEPKDGVFVLAKETDWNVNGYQEDCDLNSVNCAVWIRIYLNTLPSTIWWRSIYESLDKSVDNENGEKSGKIRYWVSGPGDHRFYYKVRQRKRLI